MQAYLLLPSRTPEVCSRTCFALEGLFDFKAEPYGQVLTLGRPFLKCWRVVVDYCGSGYRYSWPQEALLRRMSVETESTAAGRK